MDFYGTGCLMSEGNDEILSLDYNYTNGISVKLYLVLYTY